MALKTAQKKPEAEAAPRQETPPELFDFDTDFSILREESKGAGQECSQVLRNCMEQLSQAVPLEPEEEQKLWLTLDGLYSRLRSGLAFFGCAYSFAVRCLEELDTAESLNDIFPQSLQQRIGREKLLEQSRRLLLRCSEIHERMRAAFAAGDGAALEKERAAGAKLAEEYPLMNELVFQLVEQLQTHQLVMDSGERNAMETLASTVLFCSPAEFGAKMDATEKLLAELGTVRNKLVFSYLRLVFSIAKKFQRHGVPLVDLIQEGNVGLMRAVDRFDTGLGHRFSTYATWWIKQCVCHAVARQSRVIRLPMHMLAALSKINKAEQDFLLETGREATPDEIADRLGMTRERVSSLKRMSMQSISLQSTVYSGKNGRDILLEDTVENMHDGDDPMHNLAKRILSDKLTQILSSLPPRTRKVLTLRYGLDGSEPMSLNEISRHFRISRERIRQIESHALNKMRNPETISLLEDYFS